MTKSIIEISVGDVLTFRLGKKGRPFQIRRNTPLQVFTLDAGRKQTILIHDLTENRTSERKMQAGIVNIYLKQSNQHENTEEPRVYAYCRFCGVNVDVFIGTEKEYRKLKFSLVCQRCGKAIHNSETLVKVVEKGILAPYQISVD